MINLWYVFDDKNKLWMTDDPIGWSEDWSNAKEFSTEEEAVTASLDGEFVVFGWVQ